MTVTDERVITVKSANAKLKSVLFRMNEKKYLDIRHQLLDEGKTFSRFVNDAIDRHFAEMKNQEKAQDDA